jgi:hypothetical protein
MINIPLEIPAVYAPPTWSFIQPATAIVSPALARTYFYRSDTNRRWERFGYTTEDARSLVEWLNTRGAQC